MYKKDTRNYRKSEQFAPWPGYFTGGVIKEAPDYDDPDVEASQGGMDPEYTPRYNTTEGRKAWQHSIKPELEENRSKGIDKEPEHQDIHDEKPPNKSGEDDEA